MKLPLLIASYVVHKSFSSKNGGFFWTPRICTGYEPEYGTVHTQACTLELVQVMLLVRETSTTMWVLVTTLLLLVNNFPHIPYLSLAIVITWEILCMKGHLTGLTTTVHESVNVAMNQWMLPWSNLFSDIL